MGTLLMGITTQITDNSKYGVVVIACMFVIGGIIFKSKCHNLDKFDYYMMKGEINHVTTKQIYQNNKYLYYHHDDDYYNLHLLWLLCT